MSTVKWRNAHWAMRIAAAIALAELDPIITRVRARSFKR